MDNYYALFDLPVSFRVDEHVLRKKYFELSRQSHPDFFATTGDAMKEDALEQSTRINNGYRILNSKALRIKYLLELKEVLNTNEKEVLPPAFLMEMMELNEMIDSATAQQSDEVKARVDELTLQLEQELQQTCDVYDATQDPKALYKVKEAWHKQKYLLRIHEAMHKFARQ